MTLTATEPTPTAVEEATELIDGFIRDITHQSIVDTNTVTDRLLEIRTTINREPT